MAISGINPKCYILALFVRDDGARFLLGDDPFEFKDNQLHFQQNTMANDVVEVQGNDGYLLAGQVRRPGTQVFDGYVCNGTNSKEDVEAKRRSFLQFFRRSHFYKVIYVFPNGTAIQRKQGFLVDDPTVQELYQLYPEYHVALNFEDVNYYTYEEDDQGHEIYAKEAIVSLARGGATGGLIWDNYGVVWEDPWSLPLSISGVQFQILNNAGVRAPIDNVQLLGDTYQQTYSGKNLFNKSMTPTVSGGGANTVTETDTGIRITVNTSGGYSFRGWVVGKVSDHLNQTLTLSATVSKSASGVAPRIHLAYCDSSGGNRKIISYANGIGEKSCSGQITTSDADGREYILVVLYGSEGTGASAGDYSQYDNAQLELGSQPTSYEPYTNGPSPNPDYPQAVQTVTGAQTVTVCGKNLFDKDNYNLLEAYWGGTSTEMIAYPGGAVSVYIKAKPNTTYTASKTLGTRFRLATTVDLPQGGTVITNKIVGDSATSLTITTGPNDKYLSVFLKQANESATLASVLATLQIEQGSTVTTYEPYQGQSYTIDLGATELCKIGDYQDYIYKSGDDWYVHKECNNITIPSTNWTLGLSGQTIYYTSTIVDYAISDNTPFCSAFKGMVNVNGVYGANANPDNSCAFINVSGSTTPRFYVKSSKFATAGALATWITNNSPTICYALETPTDTKITDATLIGQLNTLGTMKLFIGENNVLVSTTEPNLPATLAFNYYTKFAAIGAEWEEGGTKGPTIVNVDAIDNTYPVWQLTGPATNPTLSVLTTNTALTYNGTITASQTLVIDMFNKTATLNGTSVIGNISGDFVYMAPGTNRLAYTAGNTDAPESTIYWQEVVG